VHWVLSGERRFVPKKEITIIMPAYNEASRIQKSIREIERAVSDFSGSYEIIVAEDGSTDDTESIVANLAKSDFHLTLLHSTVRLGKGKAVKSAVRSASGEVIVFMDVDLATSLSYLPQIVKVAQANRGLAIGSRHLRTSQVQRRISRTLFSLTYNLAVRLLFHDGIHDHQCGFKAMSREAAEVLLAKTESDGFFFDTEMILWCRKLDLPATEVGVKWTETRKKGGSAVRLFPDSAKLGWDLLRFRLTSDP
jgi:glycosyltransferase involved in cell wall biosynthesis